MDFYIDDILGWATVEKYIDYCIRHQFDDVPFIQTFLEIIETAKNKKIPYEFKIVKGSDYSKEDYSKKFLLSVPNDADAVLLKLLYPFLNKDHNEDWPSD